MSANSPRIRNSNGDSKTRKIMRRKGKQKIKEKGKSLSWAKSSRALAHFRA
jgi:hypothetical protein